MKKLFHRFHEKLIEIFVSDSINNTNKQTNKHNIKQIKLKEWNNNANQRFGRMNYWIG